MGLRNGGDPGSQTGGFPVWVGSGLRKNGASPRASLSPYCFLAHHAPSGGVQKIIPERVSGSAHVF